MLAAYTLKSQGLREWRPKKRKHAVCSTFDATFDTHHSFYHKPGTSFAKSTQSINTSRCIMILDRTEIKYQVKRCVMIQSTTVTVELQKNTPHVTVDLHYRCCTAATLCYTWGTSNANNATPMSNLSILRGEVWGAMACYRTHDVGDACLSTSQDTAFML